MAFLLGTNKQEYMQKTFINFGLLTMVGLLGKEWANYEGVRYLSLDNKEEALG